MESEWVMPRVAGTSGLGYFIHHPFACGFGETALPFNHHPFACGFGETALPFNHHPFTCGFGDTALPFIHQPFAWGFGDTALPGPSPSNLSPGLACHAWIAASAVAMRVSGSWILGWVTMARNSWTLGQVIAQGETRRSNSRESHAEQSVAG
jgi:hypothetical protein